MVPDHWSNDAMVSMDRCGLVGGILCKRDQEPHVFLDISDKNGTSKLNKLAIFDQKWNFWNLVANIDK